MSDGLLTKANKALESGTLKVKHLSSISYNPPTHYLHIPFTPYEWEALQLFLNSNDKVDLTLFRDYLKAIAEMCIKNDGIYGYEIIRMGLKEIGVKII